MAQQRRALTAENRGHIINIVALVAFIGACLATFVKLGVKYVKVRKLQLDDIHMLAAMVGLVLSLSWSSIISSRAKDLKLIRSENKMTAMAEVIAVTEQVKSGLGRHMTELSKSQVQGTERVSCLSRDSLDGLAY